MKELNIVPLSSGFMLVASIISMTYAPVGHEKLQIRAHK